MHSTPPPHPPAALFVTLLCVCCFPRVGWLLPCSTTNNSIFRAVCVGDINMFCRKTYKRILFVPAFIFYFYFFICLFIISGVPRGKLLPSAMTRRQRSKNVRTVNSENMNTSVQMAVVVCIHGTVLFVLRAARLLENVAEPGACRGLVFPTRRFAPWSTHLRQVFVT